MEQDSVFQRSKNWRREIEVAGLWVAGGAAVAVLIEYYSMAFGIISESLLFLSLIGLAAFLPILAATVHRSIWVCLLAVIFEIPIGLFLLHVVPRLALGDPLWP